MIRLIGGRFRLWMHAGLLLVAALLYVFFAVRAGAWAGAAVEMVGVLAFGTLAFRGLQRGSPEVLALGWLLHPLWDAALHTVGAMEMYTPHGYVAACFGFDLLLALLLWSGWTGIPRAQSERSQASTGSAPAGRPMAQV